jgi:hypothetical protein
MTPAERVLNRVVPSDTFFSGTPCWIFTGGLNRGYGRVRIGSRTDGSDHNVYTHRVMYEALVGEIPEGHSIDHLCRVTSCCNPAHLEPVTHAENVARGLSGHTLRSKTNCPSGHPYSGDNLYIHPTGRRCCRACSRIRRAKWRATQKMQVVGE